MTLIIEDGTGKPDAQAYVSAADCKVYADARGLTFTDDDKGEAALVRATTWLDAAYRWPGTPTNGRDQALAWPRADVTDVAGLPIDDDEVPTEIINASCEAAILELQQSNILTPVVTPGKIYKSAAVSGAVSVTYATDGTVESQRPVLTVIDGILSSLIGHQNRGDVTAMFGQSVRA